MTTTANTIFSADDITRALWDAPAANCPPDGAVLAFPGTGRRAWPGERHLDGVEWCHDCRADGFGFIRARMLAGAERVAVSVDNRGSVTLTAADPDPAGLVGRCIGHCITGREAQQLRKRLSI